MSAIWIGLTLEGLAVVILLSFVPWSLARIENKLQEIIELLKRTR